MCNNCKEDIKEVDSQELLNGAEEIELQANPNEIILPPIELPFEYFEESEEFQKGVKDGMYLAGYITTLLNVGISSTDVLSMLINRETIEMNIKLAETNAKATVEAAKHQSIMIEKQQI